MLEKILALLFPPKLPGKIHEWNERAEPREFDEQGWAGNVREHYRDAIQRHWAEDRVYAYRRNSPKYWAQLLDAEESAREIEMDLISQGYVNTIHDCWEKIEKG